MKTNTPFFLTINKLQVLLNEILNKEFTMSYVYAFTTLLFCFGNIVYSQNNIYSDIFILLIIQIFIYSFIINSMLYTYVYLFSKKQLIISNLHILFSIFYNMFFQVMLNFEIVNGTYRILSSLAFSFLFLVFITIVTPKKNFCETIWLVAIYFTFFSYFEDLGKIKYLTGVFLIYSFVIICLKIQDFFFF